MTERRSHKRGAQAAARGADVAAAASAAPAAAPAGPPAAAAARPADERRGNRSPQEAAQAQTAFASILEEPPSKRTRRADGSAAHVTAATRSPGEEDADAAEEERKEEATATGTATDATLQTSATHMKLPSSAAPAGAVTVRSLRLASTSRPSASLALAAATPAVAASVSSTRGVCVRDGAQVLVRAPVKVEVDLTALRSPPGAISMPPPLLPGDATAAATGSHARRRTARQQGEQAERESDTGGRRQSSRRRRRDDSDSHSEASEAAPAAPTRSSRSAAAASSQRRGSQPLVSSTRPTRASVSQQELESESAAKALGCSVSDYKRMAGLLPDDEPSDAEASAIPAAKAESGTDAESDAPRRSRSSARRKIVRDDDDESEAFQPEEDEASEEDEDKSEEEEEEEEQHGRYPRRRSAAPVKFADEQARELTRRSARNHRHSSSDDEDEHVGGRTRIEVDYLAPPRRSELIRLADGRVVSEREYRMLLRSGEHVRVLRDGEQPDGDVAHGTAGAGDEEEHHHHTEGPFRDVRRSSRARQPVRHYITDVAGGKQPHGSGEDSEAQHLQPRDTRRRAPGGGGGASSRRRGRSGGAARRPLRYGDDSSDSSSSNSSSSSSDGSRPRSRRRHGGGGGRDRDRIQPLHLQIKHQMRLMEHEAHTLGGGAGRDNGVPKSKDARLADIDPIEVDSSTDWSSVGGLDAHVNALKEMVVLPLLYPELFQKFYVQPPKGVLFFGPPGTGKTLVARALANTCSSTGQRVSFFMRKGADCLSKWIGEAERQLRLLFEQAHKMQPSIIFFDEIDGLAPVRSSRQDQIHASIVSTLLALMDGLDSRGQVIVIGATNRPDSVDPALRRPGRFDRELMFSLPNKQARRQILAIHTRNWDPPLSTSFLHTVADACVGYCGADLKALCAEATLRAVRRSFPQIYHSTEKLAIDLSAVQLKQCDFLDAMRAIVPAAQRSAHVWARALPSHLQPLLQAALDDVLALIKNIFPLGAMTKSAQANLTTAAPMEIEQEEVENLLPPGSAAAGATTAPVIGSVPQESPEGTTVDVPPTAFPLHASAAAVASTAPAAAATTPAAAGGNVLSASLAPRPSLPLPLKPRFLLHGSSGALGQSHVGPAVLHHFEEFSLYSLDLPLLLGDAQAKNAEESCVRIVQEARRNAPCVLFWPHIDLWWSTASESLQHTVLMLLSDLPPTSAIFLVATADCRHAELPAELLSLFPLPAPGTVGAAAASASSDGAAPPSSSSSSLSYELHRPTSTQLQSFFKPLVEELRREIPRMKRVTPVEQMAVLPKANEVAAAAVAPSSQLTPEQQVAAESSLSPAQLELKLSHESSLLRLQRMSLRHVVQKLMSTFPGFVERLSASEYPDYIDVVPEVVALENIMHSINEDESFDSVSKLLLKIDLLVSNTKEYSAHHEGKFKAWVNEACHMQDVALSMVAQIDTKLVQQCEQISKRRAVRRVRANSALSGAAATAAAAASNRALRSNTHLPKIDADLVSSDAASASTRQLPVSAAAADHAKMEVDDGDEKEEAKEEEKEKPSHAPVPTGMPSTVDGPAVAASPALPSPSPTPAEPFPSPTPAAAAATAPPTVAVPRVDLLPPPPPLVLDRARLDRLPVELAALLRGCTVEQAEQAAFHIIKCVVSFQMEPDRDNAIEKILRIAHEHKPQHAGAAMAMQATPS